MKRLPATELKQGMILVFPFNEQAQVLEVKIEPRYVVYRTKFGKSVAALDEELLIETDD